MSPPRWIWQRSDWPAVCKGPAQPEAERRFARQSRLLKASLREIPDASRKALLVETLSWEGFATCRIEGELVSRQSLQASFRHRLGLAPQTDVGEGGREDALASMMAAFVESYAAPLTQRALFGWHEAVCSHRADLARVGCYRDFPDPMQVVSSAAIGGAEEVHYEAPPSHQVPEEMNRFLSMWAATGPDGSSPLPPVRRAAWAHHHFVSIHPFEDGNGRIARLLAIKAAMQGLDTPVPPALSTRVSADRKAYYAALKASQRFHAPDMAGWADAFGRMVVDGQDGVLTDLRLAVAQHDFNVRHGAALSCGERKVMNRLFKAGADGFVGGLSAHNAAVIAGVTEDVGSAMLQRLCDLGALRPLPTHRTGAKTPRYELDLDADSEAGEL